MNLDYATNQLTKAKEIIKSLIDDLEVIDSEQTRELKTVKEAEQFLKDCEIKSEMFPEITLPKGSAEFVDKVIADVEKRLKENK